MAALDQSGWPSASSRTRSTTPSRTFTGRVFLSTSRPTPSSPTSTATARSSRSTEKKASRSLIRSLSRVAGAAWRLPALIAAIDAGVAASLPPRTDPAAGPRRPAARVALACGGHGDRCGSRRAGVFVEHDIAAVAPGFNDHRAVPSGAVHPRAAGLPLLDDLRRWEPVRVLCPHRDHRDLRARGLRPRGRSAVPAAVVGDLHNRHPRDGVVLEPVPELVLLRIAGEERPELPVLEQDPDGPVVLIDRPRWRRQNSQTRGAYGDGPRRRLEVLRPTPFHRAQRALVGGGGMGNAVVEVSAHHPRQDHVRHPADVIGVIVRGDDQIEGVVAM